MYNQLYKSKRIPLRKHMSHVIFLQNLILTIIYNNIIKSHFIQCGESVLLSTIWECTTSSIVINVKYFIIDLSIFLTGK